MVTSLSSKVSGIPKLNGTKKIKNFDKKNERGVVSGIENKLKKDRSSQ